MLTINRTVRIVRSVRTVRIVQPFGSFAPGTHVVPQAHTVNDKNASNDPNGSNDSNDLSKIRDEVSVGLGHAARHDEAFSIGRALAADDPEVGQVGDLDRRTA